MVYCPYLEAAVSGVLVDNRRCSSIAVVLCCLFVFYWCGSLSPVDLLIPCSSVTRWLLQISSWPGLAMEHSGSIHRLRSRRHCLVSFLVLPVVFWWVSSWGLSKRWRSFLTLLSQQSTASQKLLL